MEKIHHAENNQENAGYIIFRQSGLQNKENY